MFDVTSLAYPDGGSGIVLGPFPGPSADIDLDRTSIQGTAKAGMNIAYLDVNNNLVDIDKFDLKVNLSYILQITLLHDTFFSQRNR